MCRQPEPELVIDILGGRYRAIFDDRTPVSALRPLVFFAQFLQASGQFEALCPNAPAVRDVGETVVMAILAGHRRYAHLSALRFDEVARGLLGWARFAARTACAWVWDVSIRSRERSG